MASARIFQCTQCLETDAAKLKVCPKCLGQVCDACLDPAAPRRDRRGRVRRSYVEKGNTSCEHARGQSSTPPCPVCNRRVDFRALRDTSSLVRRMCDDRSSGSEADLLGCAICSTPACDNRICPQCAGIYCSLCFGQWQQKCITGGNDGVSCALCRHSCAADGFVHDPFVARLARRYFQIMDCSPHDSRHEGPQVSDSRSSLISLDVSGCGGVFVPGIVVGCVTLLAVAPHSPYTRFLCVCGLVRLLREAAETLCKRFCASSTG